MKRLIFNLFLAGLMLAFAGCEKGPEPDPEVYIPGYNPELDPDFGLERVDLTLEGLTAGNFPRMDGSTSTWPLNTLIACKLLNVDYQWILNSNDGMHYIRYNYDYTSALADVFERQLRMSQTHNSFINLIDKETDLILSARRMSDDEKEYAASKGVDLTETPIALDAFVFVVNVNNPANNLTTRQIQDIYTGKITRWKEVGGSDNKINPYTRNDNSGSQELMENLFMKDLSMSEWEAWREGNWRLPDISSMMMVFERLLFDLYGLCYTVYYYKEFMIREKGVKSPSIDGVAPSKENIQNRSYPYTTEVYAIIRSDEDISSMAYKLYELLQSPKGKAAIAESGYVPN